MIRFLRPIVALLAAGLCLLAWNPAAAQRSGRQLDVFEGVGMEAHLGEALPQGVVFRDEAGRAVKIGSFFDGEKPVILNFVYHNCPMLCNLVLEGMSRVLSEMAWTPGREFEIVTVSFAPDEGPDLAARQKERYVGELGKAGAAKGWHFLTGTEANIQELARAVGFQFKWVEAQQEYAHPAALIFLSGDAKITRYLYGVDFPARDIRAALVEASEGRVGTALDQVFLYCFRYDPEANSYVPYAINMMKLAGLLTVLILGTVLFLLWKGERLNLKQTEEDIRPAQAPSTAHS